MVKLFITAIVIVGILIGVWFYFMGVNLGSWGQIIGIQSGPQTATLQKPKTFEIGDNANPITVLATTLPQFALNLADGKYNDIWEAQAAEQQDMVKAQAVNEKGDANLTMTTQFDPNSKQVVVTPEMGNSFKPGMYQLTVKVKTVTGKDITVTQNFAWGVLAINTNKAIYKPGDNVNIGMTVLDDVGTTKCIAQNGVIVFGTAKVALTVTSPSGKVLNLSTDDGTIQGSPSCKDRSYSDNPDFIAKLNDLSAIGRYKLHMEATTVFGTRSIDSFFTVQATPPAFDIERVTYPTRIYPRYNYPVTIDVTPNQNYSGTVYDIVPSSFDISGVSDGGIVIKNGDYQKIEWNVNWQAGQLQTLSYTIHFPQIAPEYYLVGPLTIGDFTEGNEWQIASDSIFGFVQEANAFVASGTSVTATMATPTSANDFVVMNCYKVTSTRASTVFTSGTRGNNPGWTRSYDSGPSGERTAQYYEETGVGGTTSFTCNNAGGTSGEAAVEVMEYSGVSTAISTAKDRSVYRTSNVQCTTTADATQNLTPRNPDELVVTQFVAVVASRTATSHTTLTGAGAQGFIDNDNITNDGFDGSASSYDSAWGEVVSEATGAGNDTVIWSGSSTSSCSNGGTLYVPTISISQGGFQFFQNQNSLLPGSSIGTQNVDYAPTQIGVDFRIRMLLDVDATNGLSIGAQSLDMLLQFAPLPTSGLCSSISVGDWTPVTTVGGQFQTDIAYNQNPGIAISGDLISATANDPVDATYTTVLESYYQDDYTGVNDPNAQGDVTNDANVSINDSQAGEWDFSLVDNTGGAGVGTYCLELANSDGSQLSAYRSYPEVTFAKAGVVIRGGSKIKGTGTGTNCIGSNHIPASCGTKIK